MILFVCAMQEEAHLILEKSIYHNDLTITGIGKTNAAMKLTEFISTHQVDQIINIGFAGGNVLYDIGDVVIIDQARYHDFDLSFFGYDVGEVPGYPAIFKTDPFLIEQMQSILKDAKLGTLYTGDQFMTKKLDHPSVFDMEGASLYQVAWHYKIPIVSIKVISDIIGMDKHYKKYKKFEQEEGAKLLLDIYLKVKEYLK